MTDSYQTVQSERKSAAFLAEVAQSDWVTYTNENYGYQIEYPSELEFRASSQLAQNPAEEGRGDQIVLIYDGGNNYVHPIVAGASINSTSSSIEELRQNYVDFTIDDLIESRAGQRQNLKRDEVLIKDIYHNGNQALEITSPVGYELRMFNETNGQVFSVHSALYTGATTTPKDQLTRRIIDSFVVLK
jgi:hypothetical protein